MMEEADMEGAVRFSKMSLTPEQIAAEEELMEGLLPINIGAFLMPPIWGPAHGNWVTILYYPAWTFADYIFFNAFTAPSVGSIALAILVFLTLLFVTLVYARLSQPMAAHRAAEKGKTKERYKKEELWWAIASAVIGAAMIAFATWYNLEIHGAVFRS